MANELKELRIKSGYTPEFVAKKLDVDVEEVHNIENQHKINIKPFHLYILSNLYGFDIDDFLSDGNDKENDIKRGDIFYIKIKHEGHVQSGTRPCVIVQNNVGNSNSPTIIAVPITTKIKKDDAFPTHFSINEGDCGLVRKSIVMAEQILTTDKTKLGRKIGHLNESYIQKLDNALMTSLGISR